jgi:hypothetical protein
LRRFVREEKTGLKNRPSQSECRVSSKLAVDLVRDLVGAFLDLLLDVTDGNLRLTFQILHGALHLKLVRANGFANALLDVAGRLVGVG